VFVASAGLDPSGLQSNGTTNPNQTIALEQGSIAIGNGQNPSNNVTLFTDERGFVPTGAWSIGAYQPGTPARPPTATVTAANVSVSSFGQTSYLFTITYSSAAAIDYSTLAGAVVSVIPPMSVGGPIAAGIVSTVSHGPTDPWGDAQSFTVTYRITPPGGAWTAADNGSYSIELGGTPVGATDGNLVETGLIGDFLVDTGTIGITKFGLIRNPRTSRWSGTITLTNTSRSPLSGPIFVLFTLPAGAILENADGTYDGLPYLEVSVPRLAAGASASTTVIFNADVAARSYSTSYYLGALGS
jgi:hypothetical protein